MSSIRTALTTVKNFFVRISNQNQENNPNEEGYLQQSSRFGRSLFGGGASRKRPVSNVYEPEITDDEDDTPGFPCFSSSHIPGAKRLRFESDLEVEMASRQGSQQSTSSRYITRGSGIPPTIEGLGKPPWEFNFPTRLNSSGPPSGLKASDGIYNPDLPAYGTYNAPGTSRAAADRVTSDMRKININKSPTSKKNIEVITLEDNDDPPTSASKDFHVQQSIVASKPGRSESALRKPRVPDSMKASKRRDTNRFTKCLDIGRSFFAHTSIRLKEKSRYRALLEANEILSNRGLYQYQNSTALTKSKVGAKQLEVMYSKFETSPTKGAVEFRFNGKRLSYQSQSCVSPADEQALAIPRLFSTPQEVEPCFSLPFAKTKAIEYKKEPEIVDLEKEPEPLSSNAVALCISPITPVSTRRSYTSTSPIGNFSNLEDALNNSVLPDETFANDTAQGTSALALESSQKEDDQDISIIAEKIVNKSRNKSVNTLELEHTSCPYVQKRWLDDSKSSWRDNQKQRDKRIREEAETLNILKRESTLEKDLEERIRKKLTLTEIIVLEEPPEELPELTDEMITIIRHAKQRGNDGEVLAQVRLLKDTISITRGDVRTLGPSQWLNDNVINTYMGLIVLRSKQEKYPSVYAFQTFFYPKLMKEGYSNMLKRWTRKDDIFAHDLIIFPIHLGLHWCLACVDLRHKTIRYYDSLGGDNYKCLNLLLEYISREMKERKGKDLDVNEWNLENVKGIPHQQNGSDCGMFSCKFAEYLSRDANFIFKQEDMPYYRERMIYELIRSDLLHP